MFIGKSDKQGRLLTSHWTARAPVTPLSDIIRSSVMLVQTNNANANRNASASASKHTCELTQRNCKRKHKGQRKKWKIFHFLALAFHACEQGQRKRKIKNARSMSLRFTFKPRWRPPKLSLTARSQSLFFPTSSLW